MLRRRSSSRFAHTHDWADRLDTGTSIQCSVNKADLSRRHLGFHDDIDLYLLRAESAKSTSALLKSPPINAKVVQRTLPPKRTRHSLRREKTLFAPRDSSGSPVTGESPPLHVFISMSLYRVGSSCVTFVR